jgi:hypothetical protein
MIPGIMCQRWPVSPALCKGAPFKDWVLPAAMDLCRPSLPASMTAIDRWECTFGVSEGLPRQVCPESCVYLARS